MKKNLCLFLSILLLSALMAPAVTLAGETKTFVDSTGRSVALPARIQRIAPSGPLAQMVLMSLVPERFVGLAGPIDKQDEQYLGQITRLPVIGQLYGTRGELNLEELARLDPQVIIDVGEPKLSIKEDMDALQAQLGIPCVHISMNLKDAGQAYRQLGLLLDTQEKAEELAAYCDSAYQRAERIAGLVADKKVRMLYCLGDAGLNVIASGSYHAEMIDLVADNAAVIENPTSKGTGNEVDMEQLYLWNPDFIVFAPGSVYLKVAYDPLWQSLNAIGKGRYVEAPYGPYNWMGFPASVQRYLGMIWLQNLLYPQAADYDLKEEITVYYKLFYGCDLTQAQYDALMEHALIP